MQEQYLAHAAELIKLLLWVENGPIGTQADDLDCLSWLGPIQIIPAVKHNAVSLHKRAHRVFVFAAFKLRR